MKDTDAKRNSGSFQRLIWILSIVLIVGVVLIISHYVPYHNSALPVLADGTEVDMTVSTVATETTGPSGTEGTEAVVPDPTESEETTSTEAAEDPTEDTASTEPPHSHSYSSTVTKAATCTAKGVKTYTCACGDSYTEDIKKLDHEYTSKTVAPTCTAKGYTTHTCACGKSYQDNETKATGHTWGDWSDYVDGKSTRKCTACGKQETRTEDSSSSETDGSYTTVGGETNKIDPNGDPNGNAADYVAPADPKTGISWDGVSPIVYTYTDGTTGTEPKLGATFYVTPYRIGTVSAYTLGQISAEDYFGGGASDGNCCFCGKPYGDGTEGTCIRWIAGGTHTCEQCDESVPDNECHSCDE